MNPNDPDVISLSKAIIQHESEGDFNAIGDAGTSHGAAQWQPGTWKAQAKDVLGDENAQMTPENQKAVLQVTIAKDKAAGLNPAQIAAKWNSGSPDGWENKIGTTTINGQQIKYNVPAYVKSVTDLYHQYKGSTGNTNGFNPTPFSQPSDGSQFNLDLSGNAPAPEAPDNTLGGKLHKRLEQGSTALSDAAGGKINPISGLLQTAGAGAGAIGDTVNAGLELIPGVKQGEELLGKGVGALAQTAPGQAVVKGVSDFSTAHPELSGDIGAIGDIASVLPVGKAAGILKDAVGAGIGKALGKDALSQVIADAMPLENKATRIDALRSSMPGEKGGVVRKGILGKSTITPEAEDTARGTAAAPYIQGVKDPVQQIQNLNKGIKDTSEATDTFLDRNSAPSNFADMRTYMETNRPTSNLQKDPVAFENYNRATQDALDTLYATMKDTAKQTGDFSANTSAKDIRRARIAIDQQISKELGENTFGTPQYKGIKAAEIDTRNLLNRMSEDLLRYPGQLQNLNKLNEFIAASKSRGIEVDMNNPEIRSQLEKQFGLTATPEAEANAQQLSLSHEKMSHLYDARDNIIDKYQKNVGKTKLEESVNKNPILKSGVGIFKKAVPFGIADHL